MVGINVGFSFFFLNLEYDQAKKQQLASSLHRAITMNAYKAYSHLPTFQSKIKLCPGKKKNNEPV